MHRKLIHTFRALGLVLSLATAAFISVAPSDGVTNAVFVPGVIAAPATVAPQAIAEQAMAQQAIAEQAVTGQAKPRTSSTKAYSRQRRAQAREAMALPFFSFAQGLRSGNRS